MRADILYYARVLEAMAQEGWCPMVDSLNDLGDAQQENTLAWIAANPSHPEMPTTAAEWLKQELIAERIDPAGRLSRAIATGKVRGAEKSREVFSAVAAFIREHGRWPKRDEIMIQGLSDRTRDQAFQEIAEKLKVNVDGRVRWVDPQ